MIKIFCYELNRLMFNKIFLLFLLLILCAAYVILSSSTILGVAGTAPFSLWSYGDFWAQVIPYLSILLVFLVSAMHSKRENDVMDIVSPVCVNKKAYRTTKQLTLLTGISVVMLCVLMLSFLFYYHVFAFTSFADIILPVILIIVPSITFVLGLADFLGKRNSYAPYALIPLLLIANYFILPYVFDFTGHAFFSTYPLMLARQPDGEIAFLLDAGFLAGRILFFIIGLILALLTRRIEKTLQNIRHRFGLFGIWEK